jgi:hypothetical protein
VHVLHLLLLLLRFLLLSRSRSPAAQHQRSSGLHDA